MRFSVRRVKMRAASSGGRAHCRMLSLAVSVITNYEKLKPDLDLFAAWAPNLVIVDLAPRVKLEPIRRAP